MGPALAGGGWEARIKTDGITDRHGRRQRLSVVLQAQPPGHFSFSMEEGEGTTAQSMTVSSARGAFCRDLQRLPNQIRID